MSDLELDKDYKLGMKGKKVRLIQEWLCLRGYHVCIDGEFGPATDRSVRDFQKSEGIRVDGVVGNRTFAVLVKPMTTALEEIPRAGQSLGQMVVKYAHRYLEQHPREIGGQNKGPWVRLFMNGNEGVGWPWCAGFVSHLLKRACKTMNVSLPLQTSFSCDLLAASAKEKGIFLKESDVSSPGQIKLGSFFLSRRTTTDWAHTGVVIQPGGDYFVTIEGNTNDEGSFEGYEVCRRTRGYGQKDFILI